MISATFLQPSRIAWTGIKNIAMAHTCNGTWRYEKTSIETIQTYYANVCIYHDVILLYFLICFPITSINNFNL